MRLVISVFCLLITNQIIAQQTAAVHYIDSVTALINSDTSLQIITVNNEAFEHEGTDGGMELTGFIRSGEIVKIIRSVGISEGMELATFYFEDGELILVEDFFQKYTSAGRDSIAKQPDFSGYFYFVKKHLVSSEEAGHLPSGNNPEDPEKKWLKEAEQNFRIIKKHY